MSGGWDWEDRHTVGGRHIVCWGSWLSIDTRYGTHTGWLSTQNLRPVIPPNVSSKQFPSLHFWCCIVFKVQIRVCFGGIYGGGYRDTHTVHYQHLKWIDKYLAFSYILWLVLCLQSKCVHNIRGQHMYRKKFLKLWEKYI